MKERGLITGLMMMTNDDDKINSSGSNATEKQIMEALHWTGAKGGVAVIKMNHYIGAKNFAGALLALRKCSLENEGKGSMPSMQIIEPPSPSSLAVANVAAAAADNGDEEGGGGADVNKNNDEVTTTELTPQETAIKEESSNEDKQEENVAVDNEQTTTTTTIVTKEEEKKPECSKEEEAQHLATLQQLQQMRIYHLANYHIPDPPNIPPDMTIPQPDPIPQDPSIIFRLLESLTTLRLRYEEGRRTNNTSPNGGGMEEQHKTNNNNDDQWGGHAAAATGDNPDDTSNNHHGLKLDKDKIAAAAGGGAYDEDADPLNAPDVVNAVLEFKRKLETRDVTSRRRRVDIITDRMAKKVREFVEQGRNERRKREEMQRQLQQQQQQQQHQQQLAESSTIATTANVADSGQRGVSNLPAWMTNNANGNGAEASATTTTTTPSTTQTKPQDDEEEGIRKRKFVPSEANRDINVRKQRLDVEGGQSLSEIRAANEAADKQAAAAATAAAAASFVAQTTKEGILSADSKFPPLSTAVDSLKTYVTAQIVDYLGEEEKTLIDFIMKELAKEGGCNTSSMLDEMKMVLDEDAEDFVVNLYHKMAAT